MEAVSGKSVLSERELLVRYPDVFARKRAGKWFLAASGCAAVVEKVEAYGRAVEGEVFCRRGVWRKDVASPLSCVALWHWARMCGSSRAVVGPWFHELLRVQSINCDVCGGLRGEEDDRQGGFSFGGSIAGVCEDVVAPGSGGAGDGSGK